MVGPSEDTAKVPKELLACGCVDECRGHPDTSGHDEAVAARQRIDDENAKVPHPMFQMRKILADDGLADMVEDPDEISFINLWERVHHVAEQLKPHALKEMHEDVSAAKPIATGLLLDEPHVGTELGDLRELAIRIGATQNAQGWLLPFYLAGGRREMMPITQWNQRRWEAAEVVEMPIDGVKRFPAPTLKAAPERDIRETTGAPGPDPDGPYADVPTEEEPDNWAHRSDAMRCRTCMFYVPKGDGTIGRCRHSAPTLKGWPAIYPTDWCGAHKIDETKV